MTLFFERHLRTKNLEWFSIINVNENLRVHIVFNNEDRSKDFSEDPELQKLKDLDPDVGNEYMKVHIFTNNLASFDKYKDEIYKFINRLLEYMFCTWWIFVHEVKDANKVAKEYLVKSGLDKDMLKVVDNPAYQNLNQD